ncbi:sensor histidine kinase [Fredinandcohnia sp. QZ13]|uniref:cache domain-containing sensor histidine kinase n=1 Tax=Fredinandcohnia sp. QZ13 TaxID=3073144 RepID=UPI0028533B3D|nr:sensor histidine kinase [Fredinandcohnia sp. QZ13]MDR4890073.1 sensor histidine kinase [Fredinandcohnia sp. QZ13]
MIELKKVISLGINDIPIRYKIVALLLIISILPSIGLGSLISLTVDKIIDKQVTDHTLQLLGQANKSLESYVENMQDISYFISMNPQVIDFLQQDEIKESDHEYEIEQFLQALTTVNPEIAGILIMDHKGNYISNELYPRNIHSLIEEEWYREAIENNGIFKIIGHPAGRSIKSHANYLNSEIVSGVRAIMEPERQTVTGVILIDLKIRAISEVIKDVRLGKSGYLMVIDDKGEVIYSPQVSLVEKVKSGWFDNDSSGSFTKMIDGENMQFIYRKLPFSNWTTIGVFPTNESVMEVQQINFYVISFLFIVCAFGIGASYYLSHSMTRPINQLNAFMNQVESGDLSIRYKGNRVDEIGRLGRSFNTMLNKINNLISLIEIQGRQKRDAELQTLQSQIKPHFLYNTLDTINWMARKKGATDVSEVVESLSQLFRIGLSKGKDIIPLEKEIEHIESYLKIQKARYKDKLNYRISIDPKLNHIPVIKLVLQPIVENAIYHGIKERRGPGNISIDAKEQAGKLVLSVEDDGVGISEERLTKLRENLAINFNSLEETKDKTTIGYGIMNVQARIKLTNGNPFGLSIESVQGKGTSVQVLLPLNLDF